MTKSHLREVAVGMRKQGYSYSDIRAKTGVSKATLSGWLSSVPYAPNSEVRARLVKARELSGIAKTRIRINTIAQANDIARADVGQLSARDVFMLGLGLYIGEGTKTHNIVRIVNADPYVIRFAVRWFREVCGLKDENFVLRMHIYPDNDEQHCRAFWARSTGLPHSCFQKTSIDLREGKRLFKRGKLPYGTLHLTVRSRGHKEFGVFLAQRVNAWIGLVLGRQ